MYGHRQTNDAYQAARSSGFPRSFANRALWGPVLCLAAARWSIEDPQFEDLISDVVDRAGHARGRALLTQAQGLRALRGGALARAEQLLFDATQAFATLRLEHDRVVALADHARVLAARGHGGEADRELDEVRAVAERLGATALVAEVGQLRAPRLE